MAQSGGAARIYFLGVDTGATKSEALLADGDGRVVGHGRAGAGNWETVGWQGTRAVLSQIILEATAQAGISLDSVTASGLGLAGYDWPEDHRPHVEILREIGLQGPLALVNDSFLGLFAGTEAGWGVVISAGTSCNCIGRDASGRIGRMTGGGSAFGEFAGAAELVERALQEVARGWSRRGRPTALGELFVKAAGAGDLDDLLAGLMRGRYVVDPAQAPLVFQAAGRGDAVAADLVTWAGRALADLALGVIRRLDLQETTFDLVLSGSFYKGSDRLQKIIAKEVREYAPGARPRRLTVAPAAGAVLLAMETAGELTPQKRTALLETLAARNGISRRGSAAK